MAAMANPGAAVAATSGTMTTNQIFELAALRAFSGHRSHGDLLGVLAKVMAEVSKASHESPVCSGGV